MKYLFTVVVTSKGRLSSKEISSIKRDIKDTLNEINGSDGLGTIYDEVDPNVENISVKSHVVEKVR